MSVPPTKRKRQPQNPTPGGSSAKRPSTAPGGDPDECEDETAPLSIRKTARPKGNHCPPYIPFSIDDQDQKVKQTLVSVSRYYTVIGHCQCKNAENTKCTSRMMTEFNFMTWTRFPIPNEDGVFGGQFLNEKFQGWFNPMGNKAISCVQKKINGFMQDENGEMLPNYHTSNRTYRYSIKRKIKRKDQERATSPLVSWVLKLTSSRHFPENLDRI
jgi:hypothetical protein